MEESFAAKIIHAVIFIAVCTVILSVGWNEPLRYRFMSPRDIAEAEGRPPATPAPEPEPWQPVGTVLDREDRSTSYSRNPNPREMGTSKETDKRSGSAGQR